MCVHVFERRIIQKHYSNAEGHAWAKEGYQWRELEVTRQGEKAHGSPCSTDTSSLLILSFLPSLFIFLLFSPFCFPPTLHPSHAPSLLPSFLHSPKKRLFRSHYKPLEHHKSAFYINLNKKNQKTRYQVKRILHSQSRQRESSASMCVSAQ